MQKRIIPTGKHSIRCVLLKNWIPQDPRKREQNFFSHSRAFSRADAIASTLFAIVFKIHPLNSITDFRFTFQVKRNVTTLLRTVFVNDVRRRTATIRDLKTLEMRARAFET